MFKNKKKLTALLIVYSTVFIGGLLLCFNAEKITCSHVRQYDSLNPNVSILNLEEVERKVLPIMLTGTVLALTSGIGIVIALKGSIVN